MRVSQQYSCIAGLELMLLGLDYPLNVTVYSWAYNDIISKYRHLAWQIIEPESSDHAYIGR